MNSNYLKVLKFQNIPDSTVICGFFWQSVGLREASIFKLFWFSVIKWENGAKALIICKAEAFTIFKICIYAYNLVQPKNCTISSHLVCFRVLGWQIQWHLWCAFMYHHIVHLWYRWRPKPRLIYMKSTALRINMSLNSRQGEGPQYSLRDCKKWAVVGIPPLPHGQVAIFSASGLCDIIATILSKTVL